MSCSVRCVGRVRQVRCVYPEAPGVTGADDVDEGVSKLSGGTRTAVVVK